MTRTSVACFQRGQKNNKDLRYSRRMLRGYSGRWWRRITGSRRILKQRRQRRNDPFPQASMLFTVKTGKIHLMNQVQALQNRVNNLSIQKKKTSFACFKVKQQNIFGLALIDTENLVHSGIVSWASWKSIGSKISSPMDHRVGTADCQSKGLQVLGIGEPWPVYLEGMEECYILEPLMIRGWATVWIWG